MNALRFTHSPRKLPPLAGSAGASFVCVTSLKDFAVSVFVQNSSCIAPDCASQCLPEGRTSYSLGHYMLKRRPLTIVGFHQINSATVSHGPPGNNRCSQSRVMSLAAQSRSRVQLKHPESPLPQRPSTMDHLLPMSGNIWT